MTREDVSYLVFDIESVADAGLVAQTLYPNDGLTPDEALDRYRRELMEKKGSDFVPYTFQLPISLALAKVASDYSLVDLKCLKVEEGGPSAICGNFWRGWSYYMHPTFVTFNGRGFDIPLMELAALRYGIPIPEWFAFVGKGFDMPRNSEQPRNRFNLNSHFDLCEFLSNTGAVQITGGLNMVSKILRKPGKIDTKGAMVQDMYKAGNLSEIHDYCRCDVLDTYFVFLRVMLLIGRISAIQEKDLIEKAKDYLVRNAEELPIYRKYLDVWAEREQSRELDFWVPDNVPETGQTGST